MKYKIAQQGATTTVHLKGDICEGVGAALADLPAQLKTRQVVFDCNDIARINSFGVAEWTSFLDPLRQGHDLSFRRCPVTFIGYANLVLSFLAGGVWMLIPDEAGEVSESASGFGPFMTTTIAFFLAEMGDKTQLATVGLAARFHDIVLVTMGTTLGMMLANVPAVFLGEAVTKIVPLQYVRIAAAILFATIGVWVIVSALR